MKQAILITAYKSIDQIVNLIDSFDDDFIFFIHIDKKSILDLSPLKDIINKEIRIFSEYKTNWGGVNHLKAILLLAEEALTINEIHFFHLISGEDYPAKPLQYFKTQLDVSKDYMEIEEMPNSNWIGNGGMDRIQYYHLYDKYDAKQADGHLEINRIVDRQKKKNIKRPYSSLLPPLYGGSTWWSLTRETLNYVVKYSDKKPQLLNRMQHTFCAEEMYFQTAIMNSPFADNVINDNLRYIDWNSGRGGYPAYLDETDFNSILNSNKIFARKFNYEKSLPLRHLLSRFSKSIEFLHINKSEIPPLFLVNIKGGLGNQMFQYAFYQAVLQQKNEKEQIYLDIEQCVSGFSHHGYELEKVFHAPREDIAPDDILTKINNTHSVYKQYNEEYHSLYKDIKKNNQLITIYDGYWQTEKYFKEIEDKIREIFHFDETKLNESSRTHLQEIKLNKNSVSIHVRRGDYLKNYQNKYLYGNICTKEYYQSAIEKIRKRIKDPIKFYIFSDDPDWVKQNLLVPNSIIIECNKGEDSWQDMCLMSYCRHHIIANSSFSWWGAWLGNNKDKIVIAPDVWINSGDTPDILPVDWIKLPVKRKKSNIKITLNDTTFLIPLRIDSPERGANLDILLEYMDTIAEAHIIIFEADTKQKYELKKKYNRVKYLFEEDHDPIFHRTRYINRMLRLARTAIAGIWDSDVILPVEQIEAAVKKIRDKEAVMSFPFDGHFFNVPPKLSQSFREKRNISLLKGNISAYHLIFGSQSVGGAFLVDREKYMEAGGENEHFYGWGSEDLERTKRMEILGLPVYKADGPLFHLYHPRRENSTYANEKFEMESRRELLRVCRMSRKELIEYIGTWHWGKTLKE